MNDARLFVGLLQTLLRRRWILAGTLAAVFGFIGVYLLLADPVYRATSTIIIEKQGRENVGIQALNLGGPDREVLIEVEILKSLDVAKRVARELVQAGGASSNDRLPILFNEDGTVTDELALARVLQRTVDVAQVRRDIGVVSVSYRSTVPEEAQLITNLFATEYTRRNLEQSREEAGGLRGFVEGQLIERGKQLLEIESDLQNFQQRENAVALDEEARQLAQQMSKLQSERDQAQVELEMALAQLSSLENEVARVLPTLAGRITSAGMEKEIGNLQSEIAALELRVERIYAQNPDLRGNESAHRDLPKDLRTIQNLKEQVDEKARRYVDDVMAAGGIAPGSTTENAIPGSLLHISDLRRQITEKNIEVAGLRARIDVLMQRLGRYEREFNRIPAQSRQMVALQRDRQSSEETYRWLLGKYEEARIAEEAEFGYVRVLDVAELPNVPVEPRTFYSLILGGFLGVILGLTGVFGVELMDDRLRSLADFKRAGAPLIGVVPRISSSRKVNDTCEQNVVVYGKPGSQVTESFFRILARLRRSGEGAPATVFVAAEREEGSATFVAVNLAAAGAMAGERVILIDANTSEPTVHRLLEGEYAPGIVDISRGVAAVGHAVQLSPIPGLSFLSVGSSNLHGLVVLTASELARTIDGLGDAYDRVVVCGPSFHRLSGLSGMLAEVDDVVVVAESGVSSTTSVSEISDELGLLQGINARFVLTGFDAREAFGRYSTKSAYGQYGRGERSEGSRRSRLGGAFGGVKPSNPRKRNEASDGERIMFAPATTASRRRRLEVSNFQPTISNEEVLSRSTGLEEGANLN